MDSITFNPFSFDYWSLSESQHENKELSSYLSDSHGLKLKRIYLFEQDAIIYYDISSSTPRPFIIKEFRRHIFDKLGQLSHPGAGATTKLVNSRFVQPSVKKDCKLWCKQCILYQRVKVSTKQEFKVKWQYIHSVSKMNN